MIGCLFSNIVCWNIGTHYPFINLSSDSSAISNIEVEYEVRDLDGYFTMFGENVNFNYSSGKRTHTFTSNSGRLQLCINISSQSTDHYFRLRVISFTTVDGEVHTADNLNY